MKTLILNVGLPRSGKTTWSQQQKDCVMVNPDSIRLALYGQAYIPAAEDFVWSVAYLMARTLFLSGHDKVIIDATNTTEDRRNGWYKRFKDCEIYHAIFEASADICIGRALKNSRQDLIPIIKAMSAKHNLNGVVGIYHREPA